MTDTSVLHTTFTLERTYPKKPDRVFAAWADPATKARWFAGPGSEHDLDFRPGGRETVRRAGNGDDPTLRFESVYQDIVPGRRIVYASTLFTNDRPATVSLTTVQLRPSADGTQLTLTEQGTYLDGLEPPAWREQGTGEWLDALTRELSG
jgi:uncharacterized protein YndB with AHSA1/START domain